MRSGLLQPAIATGMTNCLISLQDTVVNLERICNTPLPFAYQVHLRMSLWCVLVPAPQMFANINWSFFFFKKINRMYLTFLPVSSTLSKKKSVLHLTRSHDFTVSNISLIWYHYHSSNCIRCFFASWISWDWARNVMLISNVLLMDLLIDLVYSENPFNYDENDLGRETFLKIYIYQMRWIYHLFYITRPGLLLSLDSKRPSWNRSCMSAFEFNQPLILLCVFFSSNQTTFIFFSIQYPNSDPSSFIFTKW